MARVKFGVSRNLRLIISGVLLVCLMLAGAMHPADARQGRRHPSRASNDYNPPYSSIVVDANSGKVLQETNADSLRHPASLTKIMTLYLLFERLEAGTITLQTTMPVSAHAASQAPTKLGLRAGQTIEVEDAIKGLVTKSANDAAVVIAEFLAGDENEFAKLMTKKARALGMMRTVYRNASGLPDPEQVTTARDQALLGRAIQDRFPRYYRYFATSAFTYRGMTMRNHNRLLGTVEGVDGIKTGYTRASGFNLVASVRRNGRHIVAVILGGRSATARDARMRELISDHITIASTKRTAPLIADAREKTEPSRAEIPVPPVRPAMTTSMIPSAPPEYGAPAPQGSPTVSPPALAGGDPSQTEAIRPLAVRTLKVRLGSTTTAPLAPLSVAEVRQPGEETTHSLPEGPPQITSATPQSTAPATITVSARWPAPQMAPLKNAVWPPAAATQIASTEAKTDQPSVPKSEARARHVTAHGGWIIQVGAFETEREAQQRLGAARSKARSLLAHADTFTETVIKGDKKLYRARFAGLDKEQAEAACKQLRRNEIACLTIRN